MTIEEAKELEVKLSNDILNNIQLSLVVQIVSSEARRRAKEIISESTEEQLTEMKEKFEKAEAEAAEAAKKQEEAQANAAQDGAPQIDPAAVPVTDTPLTPPDPEVDPSGEKVGVTGPSG
tara:strand:- start:15808 stop:16167 length:360 start_codon:yes stop_codon:yes gene_type:complete